MTHQKKKIAGTVRARTYPIMCEAVEDGIAAGWYRAHKHTDKPDGETVKAQMYDAIMLVICERFTFEDNA